MSNLRKKAEQHQTYFDRYRLMIQLLGGGGSWEKIDDKINRLSRVMAVTKTLVEGSYARGRINFTRKTQLDTTLKLLVKASKEGRPLDILIETVEEMEASLRERQGNAASGPILGEGELIAAVSQFLLSLTPPQIQAIVDWDASEYPVPMSPYHAHFLETTTLLHYAVSDSVRVALATQKSKLLLMEADLVEEVLNSSNQELEVDDLTYVPHNRCFIEFSQPVTLYKTLKAVGVSIYKHDTLNFKNISWVLDTKIGDGDLYPEIMSMTWIGNTPFRALQIRRSPQYTDGLPFELDADYESQTAIKSRNIWDFLTCRNIDYDTVKRAVMDYSRIKKYRHLQGLKSTVRDYRIIKVNRTEEREEKTERIPDKQILPFQITVPGTFHKWVYCSSCNRVHRHDLIGQPCRRCQKQVGPLSNLTLKKYWHKEYRVGSEESPTREVVREFQKG